MINISEKNISELHVYNYFDMQTFLLYKIIILIKIRTYILLLHLHKYQLILK